jgi:hypothetical protein
VPVNGTGMDQTQMPPKAPGFNGTGTSEADANANGQTRKPL